MSLLFRTLCRQCSSAYDALLVGDGERDRCDDCGGRFRPYDLQKYQVENGTKSLFRTLCRDCSWTCNATLRGEAERNICDECKGKFHSYDLHTYQQVNA
jgi:hypothetical protein